MAQRELKGWEVVERYDHPFWRATMKKKEKEEEHNGKGEQEGEKKKKINKNICV